MKRGVILHTADSDIWESVHSMKSKATQGSQWYSVFRSRQSVGGPGHVEVLDKHNNSLRSYVLVFLQARRSMSSLGHDGTGEHEHAGRDKLHDPAKDEVEDPITCDRVHLCERGVVHRLGTEDVVCRPGGHNGVCDSNAEKRESDADTQ